MAGEVRIPMFCLTSVISVTLPVSTASLLSATDTYWPYNSALNSNCWLSAGESWKYLIVS